MILDRLFQKRSIQNPAVPLTGKAIIEYFFGGSKSRSGTTVTTDAALGHSPVWQAVNLLSGDVSKLDLVAYRRLNPRGREEAINHPAYRLLRHNTGEVTSNIWLQSMMAQALLYGNAYSTIERTTTGRPLVIRFAPTRLVTPHRTHGQVVYQIVDADNPTKYETHSGDEVFHLRGLTLELLGGLSLVQFARDTIGRNLSMERYGDDFFSGSAVPSGFFKHPGEMSPEAQGRFLEAYRRRHATEGQRFRAGILPEGMDWMAAGITPEDALLVDQLKFGVLEVARIFNLPPHKLGDSSKIAYKSIEEENRAYHDSSLGIWLRRIECESDDRLFTEQEKETSAYFVEFNRDDLIRADFASRMVGYEKAVMNGIMTRNEARDRLQLNPLDGGDEPIIPLNMQQPSKQPLAGDRADDPATLRRRAKQREALVASLGLVAQRVMLWIGGKANNPNNFLAQVNQIGARHQQLARDWLAPIMGLIGLEYGSQDDLTAAGTQRILSALEESLVEAAECTPEVLPSRVAGLQRSVIAMCERVAGDIFEEVKKDGDANLHVAAG